MTAIKFESIVIFLRLWYTMEPNGDVHEATTGYISSYQRASLTYKILTVLNGSIAKVGLRGEVLRNYDVPIFVHDWVCDVK